MPHQLPFLALSMLALSGMAVANVLLPSLVKLHFPDRVGTVTALYTGAMAAGLTAALMLTVPIADGGGGWRTGLGAWAVPAVLAAIPWIWLAGHDRRLAAEPHDVRLLDVARTRIGWAMVLFFGLQSMQAYTIFGWFAQLWRDAGYSPTAAGILVGIVAATSIPLSLWLPTAAAKREDQRGILLAVMACYPIGYLGLMVSPYDLAIAVGGHHRRCDLHVPADPDLHRAALADPVGHGRAVRLHPVRRVPAGRGRAVHRRPAARRVRRLDAPPVRS